MLKTIDLNSDLGESFGQWSMGDDAAILNLVSSANVAMQSLADLEIMKPFPWGLDCGRSSSGGSRGCACARLHAITLGTGSLNHATASTLRTKRSSPRRTPRDR